MIRDANGIFPIISTEVRKVLSEVPVECYAFGSRTRERGNKNDFDVVVCLPDLKRIIEERLTDMRDEFGNKIKVDFALTSAKPIHGTIIQP